MNIGLLKHIEGFEKFGYKEGTGLFWDVGKPISTAKLAKLKHSPYVALQKKDMALNAVECTSEHFCLDMPVGCETKSNENAFVTIMIKPDVEGGISLGNLTKSISDFYVTKPNADQLKTRTPTTDTPVVEATWVDFVGAKKMYEGVHITGTNKGILLLGS